jgi:malate dehydrogenase (oxaloacetate-decarboxylating)
MQSEAIHVGVAISRCQGGPVVPALHHADRLSLSKLRQKFRDLVNRARSGALRSSELSDPTVTVTGLGEQGVDAVFGIISPPQVALVGFGKSDHPKPASLRGTVEYLPSPQDVLREQGNRRPCAGGLTMPTKDELLTRAKKPAEDALRLHPFYKGKVQVMPKCPIRDFNDFAVWYSPGVAAPCRAIQAQPELVYEHTNRANAIAIISDGTRVLGLGDIGPEAGLAVMEGKALLFKYLGGVDAVPLCLRTKDPEEFVRTVKLLEPSFGGINLEDIAQPKCFHILDTLRAEMNIPVWHDDQQGTATVLLAALLNALKVVGKEIGRVRIALVGMGAVNVATYRLLKAAGADPAGVVACDSQGVLHKGRRDIEERQKEFADKWRVCRETNAESVVGGVAEALSGADVCVAFARPDPGLIRPDWVRRMARGAVVFACANPVPEIWPWEAKEAGARVVGTGRGDFPNQVNNSLCFPAVFRGTLDVRARTITDEMALAAARELARCAEERGIRDESIVPRMDEWDVVPRVATAVAMKAQEQGIARLSMTREQLHGQATRAIQGAREATQVLMREGCIPHVP